MMYEHLCDPCPICRLPPTIARGVEGRREYIWVAHCSSQSGHFKVIPDSGRGLFQAIDDWNEKLRAAQGAA